MPSRRDFLIQSGILAISAKFASAQPRKPNIVVMLASGLPDLTLDPSVRAPTLARFAQESVQFERSYVSCPESGPSQASLITGRFPFACGVPRDGVMLPANQPTIASHLKEAGYQTAVLGDWRLGGPQKTGEADLAINFIKQNQHNPFFLLVAWRRSDPGVVDDNARQILSALDSAKLANDTIVVFTSDHGYGSGPLEPSVRIPLMLRYSTLQPGWRTGVLASNVDVTPTLLGLCGLSPGDSMQGRDLMREQPQSIYCAGQIGTPAEWRMVVRGLDKLVVDQSQNVTHLYNLGVDPMEMDNGAHDPALELKRDELKALLNDWMRRTGDGMDPSGLKLRAEVQTPHRA
ncbi:MAG: sulfatase-like hydrolase/transferase [Bryobacteraceae bacterium]